MIDLEDSTPFCKGAAFCVLKEMLAFLFSEKKKNVEALRRVTARGGTSSFESLLCWSDRFCLLSKEILEPFSSGCIAVTLGVGT